LVLSRQRAKATRRKKTGLTFIVVLLLFHVRWERDYSHLSLSLTRARKKRNFLLLFSSKNTLLSHAKREKERKGSTRGRETRRTLSATTTVIHVASRSAHEFHFQRLRIQQRLDFFFFFFYWSLLSSPAFLLFFGKEINHRSLALRERGTLDCEEERERRERERA
jgi:hypothetical protein